MIKQLTLGDVITPKTAEQVKKELQAWKWAEWYRQRYQKNTKDQFNSWLHK